MAEPMLVGMTMRILYWALAFITFGLIPDHQLKAEDEQPACGMLPPKTLESSYYVGFESCALKQAREQPLWKGLKSDNLVKQSRFTFTDGHLRWIWTIRVDERVNGKGRVEVTRIGRANNSRSRMEKMRHWHRDISREDMAQFNQLTKEAGIWKFENGTWDDEGSLFFHCATLSMEQMRSEGFRFSHVNIGCNRPRKLQASLEHLLDVADLNWETIYDR